MAVEGIKDRFAGLVADAESIGGKAKAIIAKAAEEINALFGSDSHPAQLSLIQRLEQAAHIAVSAPALQQAASADPTPAGQQQPAAADQPAETTSVPPSTSSEGTSTP